MKPALTEITPLQGNRVVQNADDCQTVRDLLSLIGDKWTVIIVTRLKHGPMRFSELRRALPSISQKMLTSTLRALEQDGLVRREVTPVIPPRVDYALTDLGFDLLAPLEALASWALENEHRVRAARKASEEAEA